MLAQDTINMSIAALLQAAEYIERRDRGELDFLCLNCQSSALHAHVNMAPRLFLPCHNQLILTEWQFCLLQKRSTDTHRVYRRMKRVGPEEDGRRRRNLRAVGECSASE